MIIGRVSGVGGLPSSQGRPLVDRTAGEGPMPALIAELLAAGYGDRTPVGPCRGGLSTGVMGAAIGWGSRQRCSEMSESAGELKLGASSTSSIERLARRAPLWTASHQASLQTSLARLASGCCLPSTHHPPSFCQSKSELQVNPTRFSSSTVALFILLLRSCTLHAGRCSTMASNHPARARRPRPLCDQSNSQGSPSSRGKSELSAST